MISLSWGLSHTLAHGSWSPISAQHGAISPWLCSSCLTAVSVTRWGLQWSRYCSRLCFLSLWTHWLIIFASFILAASMRWNILLFQACFVAWALVPLGCWLLHFHLRTKSCCFISTKTWWGIAKLRTKMWKCWYFCDLVLTFQTKHTEWLRHDFWSCEVWWVQHAVL